MAFNSIAEFIAMGGHAPYVWSSWGVTLFCIVALAWHARFERRQLMNSLKRRERRERAREQQNAVPTSFQSVVERGQHDT
ncbi:heme exporter protein CcmD [Halomonas vilamensis]|uniref:Heme exporter protein D n=2 Tax=Vreelandella vilamensis TaxID=531309 RepID=A0ABU1H4X4_9GAMM|nr:heme exporter protein CcmD [Halomonas vilamensis]